MPQTTIQQALADIEKVHTKEAREVPLEDLLRPWLAITDLTLEEGLKLSGYQLYHALTQVHQGLSSYMKIMSDTSEDQLQEAACRLIGNFTIYQGSAKRTINFENGSWVFVSDPSLRIRGSASTFRQAVSEVRQLLSI